MSTTLEIVQQAYGFAKRADHRKLRELVADDATWSPAREGVWNPCRDGDMVVQTMLWRSGSANRLRPGEAIELGHAVDERGGRHHFAVDKRIPFYVEHRNDYVL